jgi:hypothetical protein
MSSLSGAIAETPHGKMVNSLDVTVIVEEASEPSERRFRRQMKRGGFLKPSGSSRRASGGKR